MASAHCPSSGASTVTATSNILNLLGGHAVRTTLSYIMASNDLMKTKFTTSTVNRFHHSHQVWSMVFRLHPNRIVLCPFSTQRPSTAPQMHGKQKHMMGKAHWQHSSPQLKPWENSREMCMVSQVTLDLPCMLSRST